MCGARIQPEAVVYLEVVHLTGNVLCHTQSSIAHFRATRIWLWHYLETMSRCRQRAPMWHLITNHQELWDKNNVLHILQCTDRVFLSSWSGVLTLIHHASCSWNDEVKMIKPLYLFRTILRILTIYVDVRCTTTYDAQHNIINYALLLPLWKTIGTSPFSFCAHFSRELPLHISLRWYCDGKLENEANALWKCH